MTMTKSEVDELNAGVKRFYAQNPVFPAGTVTHCARHFRGSTGRVHTCTGGPCCKGTCKPRIPGMNLGGNSNIEG